MIPGSAIKGLCAHFCDQVWGETDAGYRANGAIWELLFGTTASGGYVNYCDAWLAPTDLTPERTGLLLDVLTPHHPGWPSEGSSLPLDTQDPTPVPFLSVAGTFRFAIETALEAGEERTRLEEMAVNLLEQALLRWGIGGKTSSGYGRMAKTS